ncbi:MAG: Histidine transport ATP-binding protein HisP [Candidatus Erwinia impunctatus]|nr:Histidine transport ATP-binding protein HisP [Culicoides impunctatus]
MQKLAVEGKTMIVVTHEMEFARHVSSHVVFLHQGKIEEQGPPEQIFNHPQSPRLQQFLSGALK